MFIKYDIMLSQKINKKTFFAIFEGAYLGFKEEKKMLGFFYKKVPRIENNNFEDSSSDTLCGISNLVMEKQLNHLDTFCIEFIAKVP